jgi:UDP-4-amino-4,6-dideoxy-N-acetyl-beta-L-altrosamine N-acetyltransferase
MQLEDQETVLKWRCSDPVAKNMFTSISHSLKDQVAWYQEVNRDASKAYWVFSFGRLQLGVINLVSIETKNQSAIAGYYIGDSRYYSLGSVIPLYLYNHAFFTLGLNKLYGYVLASNKQVLRLHDLHGYDKVGVLKEHVCKNGKFEDVIVIELMASRWRLACRYHSYLFNEE